MSFIDNIKLRAKKDKKRIVLPETMDKRIIDASEIILREGIADLILIGDPLNINNNYVCDNATIINPKDSDITSILINNLYELRKNKGLSIDDAKRLILEDYMYFACMLVKLGYADGVVSGVCHSTSNTLRPALQIIKTDSNASFASAFFLMETNSDELGDHGVLIFADCGLVEYPSDLELADIAGMSAYSFKNLVLDEPLVAMLSYSTNGSAKSEYVDKVKEATRIAKNKYPEINIDGELQLDAAIIPEVAKLKTNNTEVAGHANVLIFPNLDAGNIGYKLVERFAKAKAYGPITQGMAAPVNDLSRGSSVDEIVGVVAITAVQAQKK